MGPLFSGHGVEPQIEDQGCETVMQRLKDADEARALIHSKLWETTFPFYRPPVSLPLPILSFLPVASLPVDVDTWWVD